MSKSARATLIVPKETMKKMGITKKEIVPKPDKDLGSYYHHITNGGITVRVARIYCNDDPSEPDAALDHLQFEYSHMGNTATIDCYEFDAAALRKMSEALLIAATEMKRK